MGLAVAYNYVTREQQCYENWIWLIYFSPLESSEDEDDDVDYSDVFDYQMLLPTRITTTATTTSKILFEILESP